MLKTFITVLRHELRLNFRRRMDVLNAVLFFMLTVILFPIGIGPQSDLLHELGYGVIWVAAIFASILGLGRLFEPDYEDGTLNLYQTLPVSLEIVVLAKIIANWLSYCVPVVVISPIAGAMFGLTPDEWGMLALTLLLATPIFVMIGAIGAALSLGAKKGRIMLSLLVMPFYVPVLIFGVNTSRIYINDIGGDIGPSITILCGLMLFSIPLSAWVSGFIIRGD